MASDRCVVLGDEGDGHLIVAFHHVQHFEAVHRDCADAGEELADTRLTGMCLQDRDAGSLRAIVLPVLPRHVVRAEIQDRWPRRHDRRLRRSTGLTSDCSPCPLFATETEVDHRRARLLTARVKSGWIEPGETSSGGKSVIRVWSLPSPTDGAPASSAAGSSPGASRGLRAGSCRRRRRWSGRSRNRRRGRPGSGRRRRSPPECRCGRWR